MTKEAWWLNTRERRYVRLPDRGDHAIWLSNPDNAKRIGLSPRAINKIQKLDPFKDRKRILLIGMSEMLVRVRGHGESISFEFIGDTKTILRVIAIFGWQVGLGEFITVYLANLQTKEKSQMLWGDFMSKMNN